MKLKSASIEYCFMFVIWTPFLNNHFSALKCDILFGQEYWLAQFDLLKLGNITENYGKLPYVQPV